MAVSYVNALSTDMLITEISALIAWRDDLLRRSFYPESQTSPYTSPRSALLDWSQNARDREMLDAQVVSRLELVFSELMRIGEEVAANQGLALPDALYERLNQQFYAYLDHIQRLHQELADTAGAIDTLTGLRTPSGLRAELKREQDRFDRKGTSFSIASIEIDDLDVLQEKYTAADLGKVYAGVAEMIARTIRSFDDAYYLGRGEYLVILKHVEFMDACAVMDRLCSEIGNTPVALQDAGRLDVTASFGIAEAQEKEQPDGVVNHAKAARQQAKAAGGNRVQEYHEKSALEHFARDLKRDR